MNTKKFTLMYGKPVRTSQITSCASIRKANHSVLLMEVIAGCTEIHKKKNIKS